MKKSVSKRIRITKNKKIVRRSMGIDHFRAKKNGKRTRNTRKSRGLNTFINHGTNY